MNDVELATAIWVHWFNTERPPGSIGRVSPVEFENTWHAAQAVLAAQEASVSSSAAAVPVGRFWTCRDRREILA